MKQLLIEVANRACVESPEDPVCWFIGANVCEELGKYDEAYESLNNAIRFESNEDNKKALLNNLARIRNLQEHDL